jgi:hypothetical protein
VAAGRDNQSFGTTPEKAISETEKMSEVRRYRHDNHKFIAPATTETGLLGHYLDTVRHM